MNMFGRHEHNNSSSSNLVEFRAGRMNMIGRLVHPDTRKGLVYLSQSDDGLMHFCWKDRTSGKVEDDLIVFPDEYEFERVEQCKTGRVYVLKFKTSSRRMFFWMQEPKSDKDDENCRRVNELMNNPPSASRSSGGNDNGDLHYVLNNMSQQQLMQLFGGVGQMGSLSSLLGSMNRTSENSRSGNTNSRYASSILTPDSSNTVLTPSAPKSKGSEPNSSDETENGSNAGEIALSLNIDLSSAIASSDAINAIIADAERTQALTVHLPESHDSNEKKKQQIKETINSPQFQQALSLFSNAFQTAQLGPVVSQFELPPDAIAAAYSGNLEDFVKALENSLPSGASMNANANKATTDAGGKSKGSKAQDAPTAADKADKNTKPTE